MPSIHEVKGVGPTMAAALSEKGILTPEQLANVKMDDLLMVSGVGASRAEMLIDAAKEAVGTSSATSDMETEQKSPIAATQIVEDQAKAGTSANGDPTDVDKTDPRKSKDDPVTTAPKKTEEASQVASERSKTRAVVSSKPSGGEKANSKKSGKSKKAKKAKGDTAVRALRKEVEKRQAALKKQKAKLKRAKKALKQLA